MWDQEGSLQDTQYIWTAVSLTGMVNEPQVKINLENRTIYSKVMEDLGEGCANESQVCLLKCYQVYSFPFLLHQCWVLSCTKGHNTKKLKVEGEGFS